MKVFHSLTLYLCRLADRVSSSMYVPSQTGSHHPTDPCIGLNAASSVHHSNWPDSATRV
jgi:hypothetical protein